MSGEDNPGDVAAEDLIRRLEIVFKRSDQQRRDNEHNIRDALSGILTFCYRLNEYAEDRGEAFDLEEKFDGTKMSVELWFYKIDFIGDDKSNRRKIDFVYSARASHIAVSGLSNERMRSLINNASCQHSSFPNEIIVPLDRIPQVLEEVGDEIYHHMTS